MCEPATASLALTALGTAAAVGGTLQQGAAAKAQGRYQAQVLDNNRVYAERQANDALLRGENEESQARQRTAALKGRQKAVMAANGVVVNEGSAVDTLADTAALGEYDALVIRSNAEREAFGYRVQAQNFGAEGAMARARGDAAQRSSLFAAGGTLLTGAGSVADKWYQYKRVKPA